MSITTTQLALSVADDPKSMAAEAARLIVEKAAKAISKRGVFTLALSGGKTPLHLFQALSSPTWEKTIDWGKTIIFFVDERAVPPEHEDSNYRLARKELLSRVSATRFYRIKGEEDPDKAARIYEQQLEEHFSLKVGELPRFDCVHLGVGGDGHIGSLFPGDPALDIKGKLVTAVYDKNHTHPRITMTLPVLNNARCCIFMASGRAKHHVLYNALNLMATPMVPAQMVRPHKGRLCWIIDDNAYQG